MGPLADLPGPSPLLALLTIVLDLDHRDVEITIDCDRFRIEARFSRFVQTIGHIHADLSWVLLLLVGELPIEHAQTDRRRFSNMGVRQDQALLVVDDDARSCESACRQKHRGPGNLISTQSSSFVRHRVRLPLVAQDIPRNESNNQSDHGRAGNENRRTPCFRSADNLGDLRQSVGRLTRSFRPQHVPSIGRTEYELLLAAEIDSLKALA